ncbi:uncharacterized protein LOC111009818 [Momordica charantia]|uniref:Uncharacterized protein LOC111009818 n=1 Tax=Momordica charantia TaxID=3673 RepID=A0A6J1CC23_MOMCH|nr:uncharacterized protein LOC111009818 [Momordica charantia]
MSQFRALHRHIDSYLKLRYHFFCSQSSHSLQVHTLTSISRRTRNFSLKIEEGIGPEIVDVNRDIRTDFVVDGAVRSNRSAECRERERRNQDNVLEGSSGESERGAGWLRADSGGSGKLTRKGKPGSLYVLVSKQNGCTERREVRMREDALVRKELSPDIEMLVRHLYGEGYFSYANFLPDNKLVLSYFEYRHGRDFIKSAAERFGRDNQEIAKWLSGSDLRKVALLGCPSTARKDVFSAKRLRKFFGIQEDTVCHKCILRHSCKTETPSNTRRYEGFCKPVAERDIETKPNRVEELVLGATIQVLYNQMPKILVELINLVISQEKSGLVFHVLWNYRCIQLVHTAW